MVNNIPQRYTPEDKPYHWSCIHTSPVDSRHQIEVWENRVTKARYYIPYYSRTGRTWSNYFSHNQRVACTSYASAMKHIKRNSKDTEPRVLQSVWDYRESHTAGDNPYKE